MTNVSFSCMTHRMVFQCFEHILISHDILHYCYRITFNLYCWHTILMFWTTTLKYAILFFVGWPLSQTFKEPLIISKHVLIILLFLKTFWLLTSSIVLIVNIHSLVFHLFLKSFSLLTCCIHSILNLLARSVYLVRQDSFWF